MTLTGRRGRCSRASSSRRGSATTGRGQLPVEQPADLRAAHEALGGVPAVLEQRMTLDLELSVVLARGASGEVRAFPPAENWHAGGILDISVVPARASGVLVDEAVEPRCVSLPRLDHVGTIGVELFVSDGELLVNEIAPRPQTAVTTRSTAAPRTSSSSRCGRCAGCRSPTSGPTRRA